MMVERACRIRDQTEYGDHDDLDPPFRRRPVGGVLSIAGSLPIYNVVLYSELKIAATRRV